MIFELEMALITRGGTTHNTQSCTEAQKFGREIQTYPLFVLLSSASTMSLTGNGH
jgi:hypothetical protein